MKLHRFIGAFDLSGSRVHIEDREVLHQMKDVLKLRQDEQLVLCDGQGHEARGTLERQGNEITVHILERYPSLPESRIKMTLYCAILKRENFEIVVQKATEIGVTSIAPLLTKRTVKTQIKTERLQKIIHEAAEQSGRGFVPELKEAMTFSRACEALRASEQAYFFDIPSEPSSVAIPSSGEVSIFVGPEGGWDEEEIRLVRQKAWPIVGLGSFTLRAETAAIVACYHVLHAKSFV